MVELVVSAEEAGERADVVLARRAGVARGRAQEALKSGTVTVSGRTVRPSHRLEEGELVRGEVVVEQGTPPEAENIPIAVRYSDDRVLVVSKPAGLVVHPAGGHETGTLVNALLGLGGDLAGEGSMRPGIVHRLDKDTSGLLLVARDDEAHTFLTEELKHRRISRRYLALVRGQLPAPSGTIEAPIGRHRARRRLMGVVAGGRPAVTHYKVLETAEDVTLAEVTLETGRTHQIRVHLSHLGNPVVGDSAYGGKGEAAAAIGLTRPFLHAWKLDFPHPDDNRTIEVADPLPPDLTGASRRAGLSPPALPDEVASP